MDIYRSEIGMVIFCPVQRTALSSLLSHIMGISIGTATIMLMSMVPLMIIQPFSSMDLKLHSHGLYQTLRSTVLNVSGYSKDFCVMEPFGDDNASVKELKDYESRLVIFIGNPGTIDLLDDHGLKLISESRRQQNLPPLRPHWQ